MNAHIILNLDTEPVRLYTRPRALNSHLKTNSRKSGCILVAWRIILYLVAVQIYHFANKLKKKKDNRMKIWMTDLFKGGTSHPGGNLS